MTDEQDIAVARELGELNGQFKAFMARMGSHERNVELWRQIQVETQAAQAQALARLASCPEKISQLYDRFWSLAVSLIGALGLALGWVLVNSSKIHLLG